MSQVAHNRARRRRHAWLALPLAALMALLSPAGVAQSTPRPELTVMTRNLYLGSSLTPALVATDPGSFLGAVATIYGTAQSTNFPARAEALADEIETHLPDLVGLQEVTRWETSGPGVPPTQDFLSILTGELAERGLDYTVASVANNANIGPIPLATPCVGPFGSCLVTLKDRDVILVNAGREGLTWRSPRSGNFTAQQVFTPPVPGAAPVSFNRGWTSIDGRYQGKSFRFVNTHFETEDFQEVQEAQAAEFLAGPARGGQVIAVGDFNSAADGSTTTSYAQLTAPRAFTDAWTVNHADLGLTCCQDSNLANDESKLGSRIDLILTRGPIRPISAKVVGDEPFQVKPPFWASDHAGVVARVRIR